MDVGVRRWWYRSITNICCNNRRSYISYDYPDSARPCVVLRPRRRPRYLNSSQTYYRTNHPSSTLAFPFSVSGSVTMRSIRSPRY